MLVHKLTAFLATCCIILNTAAGRTISLASPDGRIRFVFRLTDTAATYSVYYNGTRLIDPSSLSLSFLQTGDFSKDLILHQPVFRKGEDNYTLLVGKTKYVNDQYREMELPLEERSGHPAAYEGQPGFDFIKAIPGTWDQTLVPVATPGQSVTITRRNGSDWFVGTINNGTARTVTIPLSFLPPGQYEATIYSDTEEAAAKPNELNQQTRTVSSTDTLSARLASGGGQAVLLKPIL